MPKVLTHAEYLTIRRGLAAGRRQTEIARELNMSVWTIARIADRRRFISDDQLHSGDLPTEELVEDDSPPDYLAKNLHRCPSCGAMVYLWPCLACRHGVATPAISSGEVPHSRPAQPAQCGEARQRAPADPSSRVRRERTAENRVRLLKAN